MSTTTRFIGTRPPTRDEFNRSLMGPAAAEVLAGPQKTKEIDQYVAAFKKTWYGREFERTTQKVLDLQDRVSLGCAVRNSIRLLRDHYDLFVDASVSVDGLRRDLTAAVRRQDTLARLFQYDPKESIVRVAGEQYMDVVIQAAEQAGPDVITGLRIQCNEMLSPAFEKELQDPQIQSYMRLISQFTPDFLRREILMHRCKREITQRTRIWAPTSEQLAETAVARKVVQGKVISVDESATPLGKVTWPKDSEQQQAAAAETDDTDAEDEA